MIERSSFPWAAFVLGIAFSGFFDGILLHQVLQWHHLLSLVPGPIFQDPRVQIFADGMFHVLMYIVAGAGLIMAWRANWYADRPELSRQFGYAFAVGFGAWNVVDVVLFHWILHIHNIRLNVANPVAWDIGWLLLFGIAPLVLFLRSGRGGKGRISTRAFCSLTLLAGLLALRPVTGDGTTVVLFRPGISDVQKLAAISDAKGRLIASDRSHDLLVIALDPNDGHPWLLYRQGALLVGGTAFPGCLIRPEGRSEA